MQPKLRLNVPNEAYWDEGLTVNTTQLPAIQRKAREVVVVLFVGRCCVVRLAPANSPRGLLFLA